jgi:protein-disulfide isomerase
VFEQYARDGKLTIEYRQFPLNMHKNAYRNAIAALCSAEQGKYMEAKDALYAQEIAKRDAPVSDSERVATLTAVGVDKSSLESCLGGNIFQAQVDADLAYGDKMNVNGTPSIFFNGKKLDLGAVRDPAGLAKFLDKILAE